MSAAQDAKKSVKAMLICFDGSSSMVNSFRYPCLAFGFHNHLN